MIKCLKELQNCPSYKRAGEDGLQFYHNHLSFCFTPKQYTCFYQQPQCILPLLNGFGLTVT